MTITKPTTDRIAYAYHRIVELERLRDAYIKPSWWRWAQMKVSVQLIDQIADARVGLWAEVHAVYPECRSAVASVNAINVSWDEP